MTRNLKVLGLATLAVFALSAVVASAASAATDTFTSTSPTGATDLTGESSKPTLVAAGFTVECEKGTYAGTVAGNDVGAITLHPTYDGFAAKHEGKCYLPALEATFNLTTHGCDYKLTGETNEEGDAAVYVECTSGKSIDLDVEGFGITLSIGSQGPLYGVTYSEVGEGITVNADLGGITYSCSGGLCFLLPGGGNGTSGTYKDDVLTAGYTDTGNFSADSNHTWSGTHGDPVDLSIDEEA